MTARTSPSRRRGGSRSGVVSSRRSVRGRITFAEQARLDLETQALTQRDAEREAQEREREEIGHGFRVGSGVFVPQARVASRDASVLYPLGFASPTTPQGVFVGVDVTAGETPFFFDAWLAYQRNELTDTNGFVTGSIGAGKSASQKAMLWRAMAVYGPARRFPIVVSPKPEEYDRLATAMGWDVIRLAPDSDQRINPMDVPGGGADQALLRQQLCRELVEAVNGQAMTPMETALLDAVISELSRGREVFTLNDVMAALLDPPAGFLSAMRLSKDEVLARSLNTRAGLFVLVGDGSSDSAFAGLFGGSSTVRIDWENCSGLLVDLSATSGTAAFVPLLLVSAVWLREAWKARRAVRPGCVATQLLDESWELVVSAGSSLRSDLKKSRSIGLSTWFIAHREGDFDAAAADGSSQAKVAKSLLDDVSTRLVFRDSPRVARHYESMLELSSRQREWIPQLDKGRCLWLTPRSSRLVQVVLSPYEQWLCDTDDAMRQAHQHRSVTTGHRVGELSGVG